MAIRRVRVKADPGWAWGHADVSYKPVNNKPSKDWDAGYELVVSFMYGLDEGIIAKIAGLRNYDTGITLLGRSKGVRDLMFPCGTSLKLAQMAARRLRGADHFAALRLRISYPVEKVGKNSFTPWYDIDGHLIERIKHRKLVVTTGNDGRKQKRRRRGPSRQTKKGKP